MAGPLATVYRDEIIARRDRGASLSASQTVPARQLAKPATRPAMPPTSCDESHGARRQMGGIVHPLVLSIRVVWRSRPIRQVRRLARSRRRIRRTEPNALDLSAGACPRPPVTPFSYDCPEISQDIGHRYRGMPPGTSRANASEAKDSGNLLILLHRETVTKVGPIESCWIFLRFDPATDVKPIF